MNKPSANNHLTTRSLFSVLAFRSSSVRFRLFHMVVPRIQTAAIPSWCTLCMNLLTSWNMCSGSRMVASSYGHTHWNCCTDVCHSWRQSHPVCHMSHQGTGGIYGLTYHRECLSWGWYNKEGYGDWPQGDGMERSNQLSWQVVWSPGRLAPHGACRGPGPFPLVIQGVLPPY